MKDKIAVKAPNRDQADKDATGSPQAGELKTADAVVGHVEQVCRAVVDGRRAARALAFWCRQFGLGEPEFQTLWCLRAASREGFDQSTIVGRLVLSPAQVSTTVERLRVEGWIVRQGGLPDRRRNRWRLTSAGAALIERMLTYVASQSCRPPKSEAPAAPDLPERKEAA